MGTIRLIHARKFTPKETLGTYIVMDDDREVYRCVCLELPWLNNQRNISCIPNGKYPVMKFNTPTHPHTFLIENVPNRDGILIHLGNFVTGQQIDTKGCQLPGLSFVDIDGNGTLDVGGAGIAMEALNYFLPDAFDMYII